MKNIGIRLSSVGLLIALVSGCASMSSFEREALCVATGAAIGGGVGGADDGDNAVKGAIGGALVGALVCHMMDGDADDDGVKGSADQCPATPLGVAVDSNGCALKKEVAFAEPAPQPVEPAPLDTDGDGIVDANDLCPGTPAGSVVDGKGCPPVQNIVLDGVNFEFDSAILTAAANKLLIQQADVLKANPAARISITGHTDSFGSEKYNQTLSLQRARAVRNFFVDQGIDSRIVTVSGAGELEPVADNLSEPGRAKNRRVELKVIRKGQ
ncbi:OmpA family protein [Parendozoicomonas haliclonae]|uniref:Outer membrane porin F n=1 Tax=Parendozoicomonas haliclonae TaxID=1960125 RepID=A0A1X7AQF1_9GAMM|nr:OmpA family protein [Parendozoicomonas haliclonae]SMA50475.1 Outer membrane porin F precursor [Parendozoicomonas haliclonae]